MIPRRLQGFEARATSFPGGHNVFVRSYQFSSPLRWIPSASLYTIRRSNHTTIRPKEPWESTSATETSELQVLRAYDRDNLRQSPANPNRESSKALGHNNLDTNADTPSIYYDPGESTLAEQDQFGVGANDRDLHDGSITAGSLSGGEGFDKMLPRIRYGDMSGLSSEDLNRTETTVTDVYDALQSRIPYNLMKTLIGLSSWKNGEGLREIPPTSFTEILRCLDPSHFVGRYMQLHREISQRHLMYQELQPKQGGMAYPFGERFLAEITKVMYARRAAGIPLSLFEYKYLLRSARMVGNKDAVEATWRALESDGIEADTECFNQYLAVQIWSDIQHPRHRVKLRVTEKSLLVRQMDIRPASFEGHRIGPNFGIKEQATSIFNKMEERGLIADEETFCFMIVALAREGNISGIESILKQIWKIDVDAVMSRTASIRDRFPPSSPLRPSNMLLLSLAHAYGVNNSIPKALGLVDHISREYSLTVPIDVWEEIMERAYHLSRIKEQPPAEAEGKMGKDDMRMLWETLVSKLYEVKPTMMMYDKIIRLHLRRQQLGYAQDRMKEAEKLHLKVYEDYVDLVELLRAIPLDGDRASRDRLQRDILYHRLRMRRNQHYIRNWCRQLIGQGNYSLYKEPIWPFQRLPNFVDHWRRYLPSRILYQTPSGVVSLQREPRHSRQEQSVIEKESVKTSEFHDEFFED